MKTRIYLVAAVMALMLTAGAGSAMASMTYSLTTDNCSGGCNPGAPGTSMGTVVLAQNTAVNPTGDVGVTITLVSPLKFVNTGLDDVIDFNLTGSPTITVDNFTNTNFKLDSGTAGSHHFDGFGSFQYAIGLLASLGSGAGSAQPSPLSFDVHASGLTEGSFTTNTTDWFFGVDVINTTTGRTGPIGSDNGSGGTLSGGGAPVPEPASILLLGSVFLGLTTILRKKSQRSA
jgi:hypothetical protein